MMETEAMKTEIKDCFPEVLNQVIDFMYGKEIPNDKNVTFLTNLLKMADRFLMEDLKNMCASLLENKLTNENYLEMSQIAEELNDSRFLSGCAKFIMSETTLKVDWEKVNKLPRLSTCLVEMAMERARKFEGSTLSVLM